MIERVYVTRNIAKYGSPYEDRFSYKTLNDAGYDVFLKVLSETIILGPCTDPSIKSKNLILRRSFPACLNMGETGANNRIPQNSSRILV